ncbi:helix-turn-helix domain-containing protein [Pseudophaeobacter leonis]|uniref:helix-turn-helix domain-containing protein n=1 Tax=Pseudophaeobacter leonis TaxID=1144477 RepID=UPI0009F4352F|nr:helix-turn-helix domain-containing protein [Pseudophaeobacter leonis]
MEAIVSEKQELMSIDLAARTWSDITKEVEAGYFSHVLTKTGGNKAEAAKCAGMSVETFRRRVRTYSIHTVFHLE